MNGDDTFSWTKKPAVPDYRKRAVSKKTVESRLPSRLCQKCALQGIVSPIHLFQINEDEALLMCKNVDCTFMPSSNWESLIVKRSISKVPLPSSKRSSSSQLSTKSDYQRTKPVSQSSCSASLLSSSAKIPALPEQFASRVTASQNCVVQKFLISPDTPQQDLLQKGKERKTLVPVAPFLTGHAHSFSSFQTNKIEHKFQQRGTFVQRSAISASNPNQSKKVVISNKNRGTYTCAYPPVGSKRRSCSLDSDSLSSEGSSLDSRPATPVSETVLSGKKVKRIVLPPETLSKLLAGTLKLEIRKPNKTEASALFRSVNKTSSANSYSKNSEPLIYRQGRASGSKSDISETGISGSEVTCKQNLNQFSDTCKLQITPVGVLHDIVKPRDPEFCLPALTATSDSAKSHIDAINFQLKSDTIKSHIETINLHIKAINSAVGRSDLCTPLDFSSLCQKLCANVITESTKPQVSEDNQWTHSASCRSEVCDMNSSQSTYNTSLISLGLCDNPITVSAEIPSDLQSEQFDEALSCNTHTAQLLDDTDFKSIFTENVEGRF